MEKLYILKLSSNKPSFKEVTFNRTGITIIKGKKVSKGKTDTYNGVGKSLLIRIIDFCLGSKEIKEFKKLKEWEFYLDLEIDNKLYRIVRTTEKQNKVIVNSTEYTIEAYRDFLEGKVFPMESVKKCLTYRTLISRFLRPKKESYNKYDVIASKEEDYTKLINLSYLLGLNTSLVEKKHFLKDKYNSETKRGNFYKSDLKLVNILNTNNKLDIKIVNLKAAVEKQEEKLRNFEVSSEYAGLRGKKEEVSKDREQLLNEIFILKNKISKLEKNLAIKSDLSDKAVIDLYEQANIVFDINIKKTLEEVSEFHNKMLITRQERSKKEIGSLKKKLQGRESSLDIINEKLDSYGNVFRTTGSFEEYEALNNEIREKKIELNSLEKYQQLLNDVEKSKAELKIELDKENLKTTKYLEDKNIEIIEIIKTFRNLANEFYSGKESGISIENNNGSNKTRFNILADIESDSSDGINEVKIFCFDLTIMILNHHRNNFLIHDSRLLSDMDSRQQAILFRVANEVFEEIGKQYIIGINENMINGMKVTENWEDIKGIFEGDNNKIELELTDENEESKLLGKTISLNYEK